MMGSHVLGWLTMSDFTQPSYTLTTVHVDSFAMCFPTSRAPAAQQQAQTMVRKEQRSSHESRVVVAVNIEDGE
jgi:hypothetical protein